MFHVISIRDLRAIRFYAYVLRTPTKSFRNWKTKIVIDVKSFHEESAEDVATRIRDVLRYVPAERLTVTADCGFSAIPRWLARSKTQAMVAGARLVRGEI